MYGGRRENNDGGNAAPEIQQGVKLHSALALLKGGPGKQGQAQIDGRRIQSIDGVLQSHPETLSGVELPGRANQNLSEVRVDAPVALLVGVRQGVPRYLAADTHVVAFGTGDP